MQGVAIIHPAPGHSVASFNHWSLTFLPLYTADAYRGIRPTLGGDVDLAAIWIRSKEYPYCVARAKTLPRNEFQRTQLPCPWADLVVTPRSRWRTFAMGRLIITQ